jgi:hypothetical protein
VATQNIGWVGVDVVGVPNLAFKKKEVLSVYHKQQKKTLAAMIMYAK